MAGRAEKFQHYGTRSNLPVPYAAGSRAQRRATARSSFDRGGNWPWASLRSRASLRRSFHSKPIKYSEIPAVAAVPSAPTTTRIASATCHPSVMARKVPAGKLPRMRQMLVRRALLPTGSLPLRSQPVGMGAA